MEQIKTKDNFTHPEGKIQLLNGTVLDGYPLEHAEDQMENNFPRLDTTGTYFAIGKKRLAPTPKTDEGELEERKLFLDYAFRFLQYRNRILSDSRMFLCPVPIQSGLAYTGTSGFNRPTLGVYLEWWLNCENALICDGNGTKKLVYQIAGSPLSGDNRCGLVDQNGKADTDHIDLLSTLWSSFMRINSRYDEAKSLYQAFTLKQVVAILEEEGLSMVNDQEIDNLFLKSAMRRQQTILSNEIRRLEGTIEKLKNRLFYEHRDELKAIMAVYEEKKVKKEKRQKEIDEECKELYKRLKSGELDNKHYQKQLTPLKKERENNDYLLSNYRRSALEPLFPNLAFTLDDVEKYFEKKRNNSR